MRERFDPSTIAPADAGHPTEGMVQRFWGKVNKGGPDDCWPWTGATQRAGYGAFGLGLGRHMRVASRLAYSWHNSIPIPPGLVVRHKCDNPPCVNPDHLELGTHSDNMRDMHSRGRAPRREHRLRGSSHPRAIINLDIAFNMRVDLAAGMYGYRVAEKYGVSAALVSLIKRGELWPQ
jgi:hypothetical protein